MHLRIATLYLAQDSTFCFKKGLQEQGLHPNRGLQNDTNGI